MNLRSYNRKLEVREADGNSTVVAYIAVWNSDSEDMGGYVERVEPGAFATFLASNKDCVCLINHDKHRCIGRLSAGTMTLVEDDHGLLATVSIPPTVEGDSLKVAIQRGDLVGCSFGFPPTGFKERWEGSICHISDIELVEVSIGVTFPCYPETSMELRDRYDRHLERERIRQQMLLRLKIEALV
jgi:HK97 family phage prohead protease